MRWQARFGHHSETELDQVYAQQYELVQKCLGWTKGIQNNEKNLNGMDSWFIDMDITIVSYNEVAWVKFEAFQ